MHEFSNGIHLLARKLFCGRPGRKYRDRLKGSIKFGVKRNHSELLVGRVVLEEWSDLGERAQDELLHKKCRGQAQ